MTAWLTRNVRVLSAVSFLQDAASELLYPLLPIYLTAVLGAPPSVVGAIEGAAEGAASMTKLAVGPLGDRFAKRPLIATGYGMAALGKVIIAVAGEGWCFMLDAISYVAVIASLLAMQVTRAERQPITTQVMEELRAGLQYIRRSFPIRTALILLAVVSMMSMPYTVLMPAIATQTLHGGAHTLGFLMTASGVGALIGALYLAARVSVIGLEDVSAAATITFGLALIGFALSRVLWLSFAFDGVVMVVLWMILVSPSFANGIGLGNAFKRMEGWRQLGDAVAGEAQDGHYAIIAAANRSIMAELLYYAAPRTAFVRMWDRDLHDDDHFQMTLRLTAPAHRVLMVVSPQEASEVLGSFDSNALADTVTVPIGGHHIRVTQLYDARDYHGPQTSH